MTLNHRQALKFAIPSLLVILGCYYVIGKIGVKAKDEQLTNDIDRKVRAEKKTNREETTPGPLKSIKNSRWLIETNTEIAQKLGKEVRVLCWIAVTEETMERAKLINQTWGRRCTIFLMIGDQTTKNEPDVVSLPKLSKGRSQLWPKTREAFRYIAQTYINDADWFLKADTDSYVIMENLRYMLSERNASEPHYLGCIIKLYVKYGYNSGGAGYVLSRSALKKLVNEAYQIKKCHSGYVEDEDVSIGYCMSKVEVHPGDVTDEHKKNRFFPFEPYDHISPDPMKNNRWYWDATYRPGTKNIECCSDTAIAFHYVPVNVMWTMEYLLYHTRLFGVTNTFQQINKDI